MNDPLAASADALTIARAVRERRVSAVDVVGRALSRIAARDPAINAFTGLCAGRALEHAQRVDAAIAKGTCVGALAGVPFAVKAQIDVAGLTTTAGSRLHASDPPASRDATAVALLEQAGAVCLGVTNMDEFGMGGTTQNRLFGPTRNPHDLARTPGGSSGGSAAAVAGGLVPFALGTDALGSIRLPASLCGVYGLRPTRGAVSGDGLLPAPGSITTIGPIARSIDDIDACFAVLTGRKPAPFNEHRETPIESLRVGVATGYFRANLDAAADAALSMAARAFPNAVEVDFPEAARARAAATLINAAESAGPQIDRLRAHAGDFDPMTRDRFLAHALLPAGWYFRAQAFRRWHKSEVLKLLAQYPVLLFPTAPCVAPPIGTRTLRIDGVEEPVGPSLGLCTQPLAALDCPVLSVPMACREKLPVGVQLLAAPGQEGLLFRVATHLERSGIVAAPVAALASPAH